MSAEIYKKVKLAIEQPSDRPTYKSNKLEKKICMYIFQKCWKQLNWISTYDENTIYSTEEPLALQSSN